MIKMFINPLLRNIFKTVPNIRCTVNIRNYSTSIDFDKLVKNNKVVVFMKGNPQSPRCGFSNAVVQVLRMHGVDYDSHDVLSNEEMREGVKVYSSWPTIPQVFINGEFVGGCDIILQMHHNGDLIDELKKVGITSALLEKTVQKDATKVQK